MDMMHWIRTDEAQEAVFALEMVHELLPRVSQQPYAWKWIVIALHNSFQGFMVLALQGTNGLNVLTRGSAREWVAAYERGDVAYPEPKLETFLNLYKKIKSNRMCMYTDSRRFKPSGTQTRNVKKLNELRNEFIHFTPKRLSLETSGLPLIVKDSTDIINFLAFESGNIIWHEESLEQHTCQLVEEIRDQIKALKF